MLESGLFFTLGFLCSALLALMLAPAIWRRAVVLTRQRIESSVPLTLNEIQADKDQLRAEFAMSTRRLEISLEDLKERAAEQLIEINQRREEMLQLEAQESEKENRIGELEAQSADLRATMEEREERLAETSTSLSAMELKLEERSLAFEELDQKYQSAIDDFDGQKIELVARETRLDSVKDEIRDANKAMKDKNAEVKRLSSENKSMASGLEKAERNTTELKEKLTRLQSKMADMEDRLERRDSDIAKMRSKSGDNGSQIVKLNKQLDKANTDKVKLEAEIADTTLRMEALLKDASGENVENAVATFENERKQLKKELKATQKERDKLKANVSAIEVSSGDEWETERRENAIVRERINDLAAQVTAMTATLEGPQSPINKALKKKAGSANKSKAAKDKTADEVVSLADRIRALQAEVANT